MGRCYKENLKAGCSQCVPNEVEIPEEEIIVKERERGTHEENAMDEIITTRK